MEKSDYGFVLLGNSDANPANRLLDFSVPLKNQLNTFCFSQLLKFICSPCFLFYTNQMSYEKYAFIWSILLIDFSGKSFSDCVFQLYLVNYRHKFSLVIMKNWFSGWASPTGETHTKAKSCSCIGQHFMPVIQLDSLQRWVCERPQMHANVTLHWKRELLYYQAGSQKGCSYKRQF